MLKTTGTDIDKIVPPVSRFGGGRESKKQTIIDKLQVFFEKYFGLGTDSDLPDEELEVDSYEPTQSMQSKVAEDEKSYDEKEEQI